MLETPIVTRELLEEIRFLINFGVTLILWLGVPPVLATFPTIPKRFFIRELLAGMRMLTRIVISRCWPE